MKTQQPEMKIDQYGNKEWQLNGERHRADGPAIEWANGNKWWYQLGKCHRTDGPAIERVDGNKWWYHLGKSHRTDGPAIERVDGSKQWWLNDEPLGDDAEGFHVLLRHLGDTDPDAAYSLLFKYPEYQR